MNEVQQQVEKELASLSKEMSAKGFTETIAAGRREPSRRFILKRNEDRLRLRVEVPDRRLKRLGTLVKTFRGWDHRNVKENTAILLDFDVIDFD